MKGGYDRIRLAAARCRYEASLVTIEGTDRLHSMNLAVRFYSDRKEVTHWIHGGHHAMLPPTAASASVTSRYEKNSSAFPRFGANRCEAVVRVGVHGLIGG